MRALYEINKDIEQVIEMGYAFDEETGEIHFDESDLDSLEIELEAKLEACGCWMKSQKAMADQIRAEEKALAERRKVIEKRLERMDSYVLRSLGLMGGKMETARIKLSTRKSTRTVIDDEAKIPLAYQQREVVVKYDKTAIGKALKAGQEIPGAHLLELDNLQIK